MDKRLRLVRAGNITAFNGLKSAHINTAFFYMIRLFMVCFTALVMVACGGSSNDDEGKVAVERLIITPTEINLPVGLEQQVKIEAVFADGQVLDVTQDAELNLSSDDASVATISTQGDSRGTIKGVASGVATIAVSGSVNGTQFAEKVQVTITDAVVEELLIDDIPPSIAVGLAQPLTVRARMSDGSTVDITAHSGVRWSSDRAQIAAILNKSIGIYQIVGVAPGEATITATFDFDGRVFEVSAPIVVTNAVIEHLLIKQTASSVAAGLSLPLAAQVRLSDGQLQDVRAPSGLSWKSSNPQVAVIVDRGAGRFQVKGVAPGTATISSTLEMNGRSFTSVFQLTVTNAQVEQLVIKPTGSNIVAGFSEPIMVKARLSDGQVVDVTAQAGLSWRSSNPDVATIVNKGDGSYQVVGLKAGSTTITVSLNINGKLLTSEFEIQVLDAVVNHVELISVSSSVPVGVGLELKAIATMSDGNKLDITNDDILVWRVSDPTIGEVLNNRVDRVLFRGLTPGVTTVTLSGGQASRAGGSMFDNLNASITLTVFAVERLDIVPSTISVAHGLSAPLSAFLTMTNGQTFDAMGNNLIWRSSDPATAEVIDTGAGKPLVKGNKPGTATLTATAEFFGKSVEATAVVTVTEAVAERLVVTADNTSLGLGMSTVALAQVRLSDGQLVDISSDVSVIWGSNAPTVATVTSAEADGAPGYAYIDSAGVGTATISATATVSGRMLSGSVEIKVVTAKSLTLIPPSTSIVVGGSTVIEAQVELDDGQLVDVTSDEGLEWSSSDPQTASFTHRWTDGEVWVTGLRPGQTTITAVGVTLDNQELRASSEVTVTDAIATALTIVPDAADLPAGLSTDVKAYLTLSDGSVTEISGDRLSWATSDANLATVTPSASAVLRAMAPGRVEVTASGTFNERPFEARAWLNITDAIVSQLRLTSDSPYVVEGMSTELKAFIRLSNGSELDVTNSSELTWSQTNTSVNADLPTNQGRRFIRGNSVGIAMIEAQGTINGQTVAATLPVEVVSASIESIEVIPSFADVAIGQPVQFTARARLDNGNTLNVTESATWRSENTNVVTVSNSSSRGIVRGIVRGIGEGSTEITATMTSNDKSVVGRATAKVNNFVVVNGVGQFSRPDGVMRRWLMAQRYCNTLTTNGGGWRAPTTNEMKSLYAAYPNGQARSVLGWATNDKYLTNFFNTNEYLDLENGEVTPQRFGDNRGYISCVRR
ncbi:Ig-like domain-containing protein [Aeromonas cavernicola]|uniref:BIG2 domain-containing protein n=1 Tax=Aeromonas cavernicola TaxID=1006623 RepID=A0A2H9U775_9GAMM|nr:Ig-like domain-containing protein [Aeromonas cavernicola]PJG59864.1 hypothetical protein CUC53_04840 [Aeromonas cavernicola]